MEVSDSILLQVATESEVRQKNIFISTHIVNDGVCMKFNLKIIMQGVNTKHLPIHPEYNSLALV